MKKLFVLIIIFVFLFASGCDKPAAERENLKQITVSGNSGILDYGNGVYYFHFVEADFGNALSAFIRENPNLEVTAMAGDGRGGHGYDIGYWVTTKKKQNNSRSD